MEDQGFECPAYLLLQALSAVCEVANVAETEDAFHQPRVLFALPSKAVAIQNLSSIATAVAKGMQKA